LQTIYFSGESRTSEGESLGWLDIYRSFDEELSLISVKSCHPPLDFLVSTYKPMYPKVHTSTYRPSVHPAASQTR
jgi:hypothetical protein